MRLDSVSHLLPGMLPAAWRGLAFFAPDVRTEAGRRVAEHLFPGVNRAAYDDHGLLPAIVTIEGVMVGDDYVAQARAMQAAFERAGPGTLIHPWLGPMTAIMVEPGEVSFLATELRVARLSARFTRLGPGAGAGMGGAVLSTAARLVGAATELSAAAFSLARSVR